MQIGRRIYFDSLTGELIQDTGERSGAVLEQTIDEDFQKYKALADRVRETVDVLELEYGAFAQDFMEAISYKVDTATKELLFSYPDPNNPEQPIISTPLSKKVAELEMENATLTAKAADLEQRVAQNQNDTLFIYEELVVAGILL